MGRLRSELLRKSVHIAMGGFALLLRWLTPLQAAALALVALAFNLFVLHRVTHGALLRSGERGRGFSAGIALYPAAVLAAILVFHDRLELAAAVWALLAFGDGMATLAGVLVGGPRLPWNRDKSWSGLVAFVLYGAAGAAFLIRWTQRAVLDPGGGDGHVGSSFFNSVANAPISDATLLIAACLVVAAITAFAESLDTGVDDNVLVPLVGGAALWTATLVEPARLVAESGTLARDFAWGAGVNAALAVVAYAARGVSVSGAVWGWALGTALYGLAGWRGFLMLLLFFVLGTAATKAGYAKKAAFGIAQERGGRRGARNAFANTGAGVTFAFLAAATAYPGMFGAALVAAFATAAADTVSSEIGQAYGRRTYLVTTFRPVPPGTEGAVSLEGTLAGVAASLVLGIVAWATGLLSWLAVPIVALAAFAGTTLESYLGAAFEGARRLDNELLNFTNTLTGGIVAALLWRLLA